MSGLLLAGLLARRQPLCTKSDSLIAGAACSTNGGSDAGLGDAGPLDATVDGSDAIDVPVLPVDARPPSTDFCSLPGSWVETAQGLEIIPDPANPWNDLSWADDPRWLLRPLPWDRADGTPAAVRAWRGSLRRLADDVHDGRGSNGTARR
jgi:hypothetical protein